MKEEARRILNTGSENTVWFVAAVFALSGESSLIQMDSELKELARRDPKKAREVDAAHKVPFAYQILYAMLHSARSYGSGSSKEEKGKPVTALVITDQNDYYALLGIDKNASQEEIKRAYKQKSATLQTDVLEKKLKAQGLSDAEIRTRVQQAQREYEYIQEAYRKLSKELHPDTYLRQLGRTRAELTPEEIKELNIRTEKFRGLNEEY